jgi:uncharacterized protein (DUF1015 family)
MTDARAFGYLRYNPDEVDPGAVLAPPYDVIDEAARAKLAASNPHQSVLLELPEGGDNAAAGALLAQWIDDDVLELGEVGIAVIKQRYVGPDGVRRSRIGVACEIGVHDFSEGKVLPHEQTFDAPMRTRLDLMHKTGANISPVFVLYHDTERSLHDLLSSITDDAPDYTSAGDADGTQTAVWFVTDTATCELFESAVAPHALLIADGHHRYTAAQQYRNEVKAAGPQLSVVGGTATGLPPHTSTSGANGVLAIVSNSADEGICVFPTHRVVRGATLKALDEFVLGSAAFRCDVHDDLEDAMFALEQLQVPGFVVHHQSRTRVFSTTDPTDLEIALPGTSDAYRSLDVAALHGLVIDGGAVLGEQGTVSYTRSLDEAVAAADDDPNAIAFLLRAADVAAVHAVAQAGELLPQKSTYFFPKVPTGVVFRLLAHPS